MLVEAPATLASLLSKRVVMVSYGCVCVCTQNERPDPADGAKAGFPVDSHKGPVRSKMWGQSGVVLPFFQPRQLMGVEENPASDEKPAGGSSRPRGAEPSPKTSLTSSLSLKDEVLPPKKKEVVKLRECNFMSFVHLVPQRGETLWHLFG